MCVCVRYICVYYVYKYITYQAVYYLDRIIAMNFIIIYIIYIICITCVYIYTCVDVICVFYYIVRLYVYIIYGAHKRKRVKGNVGNSKKKDFLMSACAVG